MLTDCQ